MPVETISDGRVLAVILVVAVVTVALRAMPYVAMDALSRNGYLLHLGRKMPVGVMVLLVAYTLQDVDLSAYPYGLPILGSAAVALALYWFTRNALVGIGAGLACHLVAVNGLV
ncbi:branched-chain amino acid transporter permease [Salinarimonas rosea]|uniref:branched-chain amino acid transporter permease n=1 Tax=Salinarimonas rosea TaxID=552063 RepID=UPI000412CC79|nr:AzlD domain-containing protein [Salinarimonas rosea]